LCDLCGRVRVAARQLCQLLAARDLAQLQRLAPGVAAAVPPPTAASARWPGASDVAALDAFLAELERVEAQR
jgi:hypothetical protein